MTDVLFTCAKVPNEVLIESYKRLKSVWKVGSEVGLCGQGVHRRLKKLDIIESPKWTKKDITKLKRLYSKEDKNDGKWLNKIAEKMNRTRASIACKANELKLTDMKRGLSDESKIQHGLRTKALFAKQGHPKGMLGKHHSKEAKERLCESSTKMWATKPKEEISNWILKGLKTRERNGTLVRPRKNTTWKSAWRDIGGKKKYYRSRWEANYARYLQFLKQHGQIKEWLHEPDTFWFEKVKRGCRSYLPDFKVTENDGRVIYHEVKGWMDARSKTKLKRMKKYHPDVALIVIDAPVYKDIAKKMRFLLPDWE